MYSSLVRVSEGGPDALSQVGGAQPRGLQDPPPQRGKPGPPGRRSVPGPRVPASVMLRLSLIVGSLGIAVGLLAAPASATSCSSHTNQAAAQLAADTRDA